uniref:Uncharacterized protein n=1 Tax=Bracon brevicornis TaxID=1563983 RepID=A0A6V7M730_9HYME
MKEGRVQDLSSGIFITPVTFENSSKDK